MTGHSPFATVKAVESKFARWSRLAELLEAVERSPADLEARTEEQLLSLQRELLQTRDLVNAIELELAEEATQYRYPSGAASSGFKLAA